MLSLPPVAAASQTAPAQFKVVSAKPSQTLTSRFSSTVGWIGGDGDYSVPLSSNRSLWLFGDSFIGKINRGRRLHNVMVHNTAAWMESDEHKPVRFFWRQQRYGAQDLIKPPTTRPGYYWPGSLTMAAGKLVIFCKRVENKAAANDPFGFRWAGQDLILVDNPMANPLMWRKKTINLTAKEATILPGSACLNHDGFVYILATLHRQGDVSHPTGLMRITPVDLAHGAIDKFEYYCNNTGKGSPAWHSNPKNMLALFSDGAPEMSISCIHGLPGFWAVYTPNGLSNNICARHASKITGPWSEPLLLYHCPEPDTDQNIFCYGAKAHSQLTSKPGELTITYCLNLKDPQQHSTKPFVYFPHAVKVLLETPTRTVQPPFVPSKTVESSN